MPPKKRGGSSRGRAKKTDEADPMEIDETSGPSVPPPARPVTLSSKEKYDDEYAGISTDPSTPSHSEKEDENESVVVAGKAGEGGDQPNPEKAKKINKKKKKKKRIYLKAAISSKIDESIDPNSVRTFIFEEEDHTLGNSLTYIISNYPDVVFCGYSVPHPAEHVFHLRVQCRYGVSATDILKRGLKDLEQVCIATKNIFKKSLKKYERDGPPKSDDDEAEPLAEQMS